MALDPLAKSASQTEPAFVARLDGTPVHYGFQILCDIVVDGFTFEEISDFEAEPSLEGNALVVTPDNSSAGPVGRFLRTPFREICPTDSVRWGVWRFFSACHDKSREGR